MQPTTKTKLLEQIQQIQQNEEVEQVFLLDQQGVLQNSLRPANPENTSTIQRAMIVGMGAIESMGRRVTGDKVTRITIEFENHRLFLVSLPEPFLLGITTHAESNLGLTLVQLGRWKQALTQVLLS